jgi:uncharacterized membrane protein YheB (UPF0754 family)
MNTLLQLTAPPVLGAFIGYMTNYVAIKMLFRPLHPWKILGIRVPMTPGVIPSKRHMLAENIGEMVGEHLLTSNDVSGAINGDKFQLELRELIDNRLASLLEKDLGPIGSIIPKRFKAYFRASIRILRLRFISHMHSYLASDNFVATINNAIGDQIETLVAKNLSEVFPGKSQEHLYSFLEKTIADVLASHGVKEWITSQVQQKFDSILNENRSLNDIIPQELSTFILDRLEQEAPGLLKKFAGMLGEPAMQVKITDAICNAIDSFIASMGPMAAMVSNFITPDTIRNKVSEYLDEKGDDIGSWLTDKDVQQQVAEMLRGKISDFLKTPVFVLLKDVDQDKITRLNIDFSKNISDMLARPETAQSLTMMLRNVLASQTNRPIVEVINNIFGSDAIKNGHKWTSSEITTLLQSSKIKHLLNGLVVEMVENKLLTKPIGTLKALLPHKVQDSFSGYILQQVSNLLAKEVPGLVDSLNIRKIVKNKVDSLDLLRLEALLMSIMEEQFKYINIFGGLLGFLIGLLNLLILQM